MKRSPLARRTPIKAKTTKVRAPRASKLPDAPKRSKRGPARDEKWLDFVRSQPCLVPGCTSPSEAHHFGKRGKGTKCSDYETVPLCHAHHVEGWHRHGTLPGATRGEWLARFQAWAEMRLASCF